MDLYGRQLEQNMRSQWVICLLLLGLTHVYGNPCDPTTVNKCFSNAIYYETLALPIFGKNNEELDRTCRNINMSFDCMERYYQTCRKAPECDENCKKQLSSIIIFSTNSGLRNLEHGLCDKKYSAIRQIYLENEMCLEENKDLYASCHVVSKRSRDYLNTKPGADSIDNRCCFFTWFDNCFVNITRDNCGENATLFVSFAINSIIGHFADEVCSDKRSDCTSPPLPPENSDIPAEKSHSTTEESDTTEDVGIRTEKSYSTTEESDTTEDVGIGTEKSYSTTEERGITTEKIGITTEKIDITTAESDITKYDSSLDNDIASVSNDAATIHYCTQYTLLYFLYVLLSKI